MAAPAPEYTAYIKDLVDYNGNIIYPRTKVEAIYDNDGNALSIPKHFIINVTADSEGNFTADKTYAEILEAYNAGHVLTVLVSYMQHFILDTFVNDTFTFISNTADTMGVIMFTSSGIIADEVYFQPIPRIKEGDAGKILMADNNGNAVWTAITNAEGVAY